MFVTVFKIINNNHHFEFKLCVAEDSYHVSYFPFLEAKSYHYNIIYKHSKIEKERLI